MNPMLDIAVSAARKAGDYILESVTEIENLKIEQKSQHDFVSEVDRTSERMIREIVNKEFPDHAFIGEEFGESDDFSDRHIKWIVDPLDGTTNFIRGIPHFAVSIAIEIDGELEHGVVYDPSKNELFQASKGQGCFLNGTKVLMDNTRPFAGALLATGVPFSGAVLEELDGFTQTMAFLLKRGTSGIRRLGSAALDLAYVAAGRYDGFWEAQLQPWDIAAGILLVKEAGGQVTDFTGQNHCLPCGDVVAASSQVLPLMVAATQLGYHRAEMEKASNK